MGSNNDGIIAAEVGDRLDNLFGEGDEQADNFEEKSSPEVDKKLDDFFGEDNLEAAGKKSAEQAPAPDMKGAVKPMVKKAAPDTENSMLKELKSVILQLDWEITDDAMDQLGVEIGKLEDSFKKDKIIVAFLQLLGSLGKYVQKKKADAHPDSISLLNSVYESLEEVMLSEGLADATKKKMLVAEVGKYKALKVEIASARTSAPPKRDKPEPPVAMEEEAAPEEPEISLSREEEYTEPDVAPGFATMETEGMPESHKAIVLALDRLDKTLQKEFKALRDELKLWRESR